jgi:hypothetical protein
MESNEWREAVLAEIKIRKDNLFDGQ